MESQNIKPLSLNDQSAKDTAVQKTLNLMRTMSGLAPKEFTPSLVSQPAVVSAQSATESAVQNTLEMMKVK
jgi:hypothetical protein